MALLGLYGCLQWLNDDEPNIKSIEHMSATRKYMMHVGIMGSILGKTFKQANSKHGIEVMTTKFNANCCSTPPHPAFARTPPHPRTRVDPCLLHLAHIMHTVAAANGDDRGATEGTS